MGCRCHSDFRATPNYPCKFRAKAVTTELMAGRTVVKLRRGALRILQSTDLWIVLASHDGDVSPDAGDQPPFTAR
jgi:hypothetical protein